MEEPARLGISQVGVVADHDRNGAMLAVTGAENDRARSGQAQGGAIFFVGIETEVPWTGIGKGCDTTNPGIRVSL